MWLTFTKGKCCSKNWVVFFSGYNLPIPTSQQSKPLVCNWWMVPSANPVISIGAPPCILFLLPQVVPDTEHGRAHHLPARLLCVARGQEVVGAVLQAALARHHRHLPEGAGPGTARTQEDHRQAGQEDGHEVRDWPLLLSQTSLSQILPPLVHPLHPEILIKIEKTISWHEGLSVICSLISSQCLPAGAR